LKLKGDVKVNKYFLVIGLLILNTASHADPEIAISLQGPDELKYKFDGASILAPSNDVSTLEETQRARPNVWQAGRENELTNSSAITIATPIAKNHIASDQKSYINLNFYKKGDKLGNRPIQIDLGQNDTQENTQQEINVGDNNEYTINIEVRKTNPGPDVKYQVKMSARKNT